MKKLNKPEFSIKDIIEENNNYFEKELNEEINDLVEEEKEYIEKGESKKLYEIKESKHEKIKKLYDKFYGNQKYEYRSEIIGKTVRCPICGSPFGYGTLWLDHVLPQINVVFIIPQKMRNCHVIVFSRNAQADEFLCAIFSSVKLFCDRQNCVIQFVYCLRSCVLPKTETHRCLTNFRWDMHCF